MVDFSVHETESFVVLNDEESSFSEFGAETQLSFYIESQSSGKEVGKYKNKGVYPCSLNKKYFKQLKKDKIKIVKNLEVKSCGE